MTSFENVEVNFGVALHSLKNETLRLDGELPPVIVNGTFRWSSNGKQLAFFAYGAGKTLPAKLFG